MDNTEAKAEVKREPKKRGKTSSEAKRRYNEKTYTRLGIDLHKDKATEYKAKCEEREVSYSAPLKRGVERFVNGEMVILKEDKRKAESSTSEIVRIAISLHKDEAAEFKQRCKDAGIPHSRVFSEAIEDFLYGEWEG